MSTASDASVSVVWDMSSDDDDVQGPVDCPPDRVTVPGDVVNAYTDGDEDAVTDYLSDATGWLVLSWNWL